VSTNVDGCGEVIEDGVTGLLVSPKDPPRLAAAIERVLADAGLRQRLADAAAAAAQRYDIGRCVREMEAVYDEALDEVRRSQP
jgi:glycosyltransferase involved in cell wall biosynthesis